MAADFTSCAPGMVAAIFQNFVEAGLKHSGLPKEIAQQMVISTLFGTAKLLLEMAKGKRFIFSVVRCPLGLLLLEQLRKVSVR